MYVTRVSRVLRYTFIASSGLNYAITQLDLPVARRSVLFIAGHIIYDYRGAPRCPAIARRNRLCKYKVAISMWKINNVWIS